MNLNDIRLEVTTGRADPTVYNARIASWANEALLRIGRQLRAPENEGTATLTTTSGQATVNDPTDIAHVRSLFDSQRAIKLQPVQLDDIDSAWQTTGQPYAYAVDGATLRLYPTPNGIYTLQLRYWKLPPKLVADTDVPAIPEEYHSLLVTWALFRFYRNEDDQQQAQSFRAEFYEELGRARQELQDSDEDVPVQIGGSQWPGLMNWRGY
jgi:hypothetical protein